MSIKNILSSWEPYQVEKLTDLFSSMETLSNQKSALPIIYEFLREHPKLCRMLFENLIERHNMAISSMATFIPGCCCCGIVDLKELDNDAIDAIEQRAMYDAKIEYQKNGGRETLVEHLAKYRAKMHDKYELMNKRDDGDNKLVGDAAFRMYDRLTTPTPIMQPEADYIYSVLRRNECIAKELFALTTAGAHMANLKELEDDVTTSPVVKNIKMLFYDDNGGSGGSGGSNGGGGGGGGCCCCCCCCCGGGC